MNNPTKSKLTPSIHLKLSGSVYHQMLSMASTASNKSTPVTSPKAAVPKFATPAVAQHYAGLNSGRMDYARVAFNPVTESDWKNFRSVMGTPAEKKKQVEDSNYDSQS